MTSQTNFSGRTRQTRNNLQVVSYSGEDIYRKSIDVGLNVFRAPEPACVVRTTNENCEATGWSRDQQQFCLKQKKDFLRDTFNLFNFFN